LKLLIAEPPILTDNIPRYPFLGGLLICRFCWRREERWHISVCWNCDGNAKNV